MNRAWTESMSRESTAYDLRKGLIRIGSHLTGEELLNLPLFAYLAMNGNLVAFGVDQHHVQLAFSIIFCTGSLLAFLRNRNRIPWHLLTCKLAFFFLMVTAASALWSTQSISVTYEPTLISFCTFLYYCYLADRFDINDFIRMMVWTFAVLLTLSIIAAVLFPAYGIDGGMGNPEDRGAWQGIFAQKNQLGAAAALSVALAFGLLAETGVDRFWRWYLGAAGLLCSVGAASRETWIAVSLLVLTSIFFRLLWKFAPPSRPPLLIFFLFSMSVIGGLAFTYLDDILTLLGRTRNLSGRKDIWEGTIFLIGQRPWLGYGVYGVWHTPYAWPVVSRVGWAVTSSHNNYLELLLTSGVVGLVFYLPILILAIFYAFRAMLTYDLYQSQVLIYIMIVILVLSMASPLVLYTPAVGMILLLYSVSHLEKVERSGFMRISEDISRVRNLK